MTAGATMGKRGCEQFEAYHSEILDHIRHCSPWLGISRRVIYLDDQCRTPIAADSNKVGRRGHENKGMAKNVISFMPMMNLPICCIKLPLSSCPKTLEEMRALLDLLGNQNQSFANLGAADPMWYVVLGILCLEQDPKRAQATWPRNASSHVLRHPSLICLAKVPGDSTRKWINIRHADGPQNNQGRWEQTRKNANNLCVLWLWDLGIEPILAETKGRMYVPCCIYWIIHGWPRTINDVYQPHWSSLMFDLCKMHEVWHSHVTYP